MSKLSDAEKKLIVAIGEYAGAMLGKDALDMSDYSIEETDGKITASADSVEQRLGINIVLSRNTKNA